MSRTVPARVTLLLFFLLLLGLALNVLSFVDLRWTRWLFHRGELIKDAVSEPLKPAGSTADLVDASQFEQLRLSILNVRVTQCGQGAGLNLGTGFVVKAGYVATAAHILGNQQDCSGEISLIDSKGRKHRAALDGVSAGDDLAVLRISEMSLPPLQLANSEDFEATNKVVKLVTIGYPLEQAGASTQDSAAISGEGSLSRFDRGHNIFVTSGLNLNPGNSGGPIFLRNGWQVLGIASAKLSQGVGEGIGYAIPIKTFETFFREKTGQAVR